MNLTEFAGHYPAQLSGGMRQRVCIARTLVMQPRLILLDEPNTGLDPQGILDLRHLMQRLNREAGKTILFSSHILDEVQTLCNHVVVIHKGRCMVQGAVDDLLSGEHLLITLEPQDIQRCIQYMSQSAWQQFFQGMDDKQIFLQMSKQQIPALVQDLARQELAVMRVDYRNRLEDYFLKINIYEEGSFIVGKKKKYLSYLSICKVLPPERQQVTKWLTHVD